MPMQITISRNRKTSANYNSEGYGVSFTVELDQSLLTKPQELQDRIAYLYREADAALEQQAQQSATNGNAHGADSGTRNTDVRDGAGPNVNRAHRNGNGRSSGAVNMTAAQRRAIDSISRRLGLDAIEECRHELGLELDRLTVKEASRFIDHLKGLEQPAPARQNGGGH